jgi:hypothetical protein
MSDPPERRNLFDYIAGLPRARLWLALVLVAIGIVSIAIPHRVAVATGQSFLNDRGAALIDESLETNQNTFLAISGIKAGIALIEGSTVGVGVEIQVGDLIQPAYDYVDFFWNIFLYSLVVLASYKLFLETGMLELGLVLFGIGAILYAVGLLTPPRETTTPTVGRRCMLLGVLVAYVAPAALLLTQSLSERYTTELKRVHQESILEFEQELQTAQREFLNLRQQFSLLTPGQSLEEIRAGLIRIAASIGESFRLSLLAFLYYSLLIMFDLLFFPFISAWLLYKLAQVALDRALQQTAPLPAATSG